MASNEQLKQLVIYGWVGEDEFGSGEVGLKQGVVPAGCVPLVSLDKDKIGRESIKAQMQAQSSVYGKKIHLCRFVFDGEVDAVEPDVGKTQESAQAT